VCDWGSEHVSIVGIDRIPFAYYQRKLAAERLIAESGVPFSILRATQFHSFVATLLNEASRYPFVMPIPSGFFVQSVAVEEVAARLCRAIDDGPCGRLRDFGGPEVLPVKRSRQRGSISPISAWDFGRFRSICLERSPRRFVPATTRAPMGNAERKPGAIG